MLSLEIKLWLFLTIVLFGLPILWLVIKILNLILKVVIKKYQNRKKLNSIKEQIKSVQKDNIEISKEEGKERVLDEKTKLKLERLKIQALAMKERWDIQGYERKIIEWLSIDPYNTEFLKMLWELYFNLWRYNKALPILKKMLEKQPNNDRVMWQLGKIYYEKWDYDTAKLFIEKAISINSKNPKYFISLAEVFYAEDNIDGSIHAVKKALKLRPQNINYLLSIASLYEELGNQDMAKKYYYKVLEIEPWNEIAKSKI